MTGRQRAFPRDTWVVHNRGPDWQVLELGATRRLSNGAVGGSYHPIPEGLPGIFLGRLPGGFLDRLPSRRGKNSLVTVLWMGRVFLCHLDDLEPL